MSRISNLNDLLKESIMNELADLVAKSDIHFGIVEQMRMNRSRYHLIAFLVIWKLTHEDHRQSVLDELASLYAIVEKSHVFTLTVQALNQLVEKGIDWKTLIDAAIKYSEKFLCVELREMKTECQDKWFKLLRDQKILIEMQSSNNAKLRVTTDVKGEIKWRHNFSYDKESHSLQLVDVHPSEEAPSFILGKEFDSYLGRLEKKVLKMFDKNPNSDSHIEKIRINQNCVVIGKFEPASVDETIRTCDLRLALPPKVDKYHIKFDDFIVDPFYQCFVGTCLDEKYTKRNASTEAVEVRITGLAEFTKEGASAQQRQEVSEYDGPASNIRVYYTIYFYGDLRVLYPNTGDLTAYFSGSPMPYKFSHLKTQEQEWDPQIEIQGAKEGDYVCLSSISSGQQKQEEQKQEQEQEEEKSSCSDQEQEQEQEQEEEGSCCGCDSVWNSFGALFSSGRKKHEEEKAKEHSVTRAPDLY